MATTQSRPRFNVRADSRLAIAITGALLLFANPALSGPILSEIHYNGIASGTDPDEFIELSNDGEFSLNLTAWRFTQGISYIFGTGATLAPGTSLVLARDPDEFLSVFSDYAGEILDFSGALSNSGETITLTQPNGTKFWSVTYDDSASWPQDADGLGSSLQLSPGSRDLSSPSNWTAGPPTPGSWGPGTQTTARVPNPASIALLAIGLFLLRKPDKSGPGKTNPAQKASCRP